MDLDNLFGETPQETAEETPTAPSKEYSKRVAFVISAQHFIPHGGIGSFAKSFSVMAEELGWAVDYILDKAPGKHDLTNYITEHHEMYYMDKGDKGFYTYGEHARSFVFADTMHIERMANFRGALAKALEDNIYDMIVVNSVDAVSPIYFTNIHEFIPVVYYTHSENLIFLDLPHNRVFTKSAVDYMKHEMTLPDMIVGTQTKHNVETIKGFIPECNAHALPMRVPEPDLLKSYPEIEKEGVMFIGRFEPRKQPKQFADIIKKTGLKAKVLTNAVGEKKFRALFEEIGYDNFEIRSGITGQEKVEFVKSAKMGFHTANLESYGFSVFETLHTGITYCLEEYSWWKNFEGLVRTTNKKDAAEDLVAAYNEEFDEEKRLKTLRKYHGTIAEMWKRFLEKRPNTSNSKVKTTLIKELEKQEKPLTIRDYYFKILARDKLAYDDVFSVYKKSNSITVTHLRDKSLIELKES